MPDQPLSSKPAVRPLDLTARGDEPSAALKVIGDIAQTFSGELRRQHPFLARQRARVWASEVLPAESEFVPPPADGPGFMVLLEDTEGGAWCVFHLDTEAVTTFFEGLLGSVPLPGDDDGPLDDDDAAPPAEVLTVAQRALIRRVALDMAADVARIVRARTGIALETKSAEALRAGQTPQLPEGALFVCCNIEDNPSPCRLRIWLGQSAIEATQAERPPPSSVGGATFHRGLVGVPVQVVAELGRVTLPLSQLLGLERGLVLRLPTAASDPVTVRVAGLPKFDAVPVISRGQVSVQIQARREE